jgi:hypothetical protein
VDVSKASEAELLSELQRLQAVQLNGFWRLIDQSYLGSLLEMLLVRWVIALKGSSNKSRLHALPVPEHYGVAAFLQ